MFRRELYIVSFNIFDTVGLVHTVSGENADDEWRTWEIPVSAEYVSNKFTDSRTKGSVNLFGRSTERFYV